MPRGRNYSDDSRSSDVSWRSYTQNSWEEEVKKIRNSRRWVERRDETKYKKQRPKKKKEEKKTRKKKRRQRNSTSSASPTTSAESDGRTARSAGRSHTNDRGRSQSKFREESKNVFDERKERLKRKEEEAIRREFKKRRGYDYSEDGSSSGSDSEYDDNSYSTSGSESQDRRDKSRTAGGDELKLKRFDTHHHRGLTSDSEEAGAGNRTPDRRRKDSDSSETDSREANPFMRLSQLQRQRDEADPYRVGYRDDAYYQTDKNERADAEDFLTNRRRIGDAEYYRNTEQDANKIVLECSVRTSPDNGRSTRSCDFDKRKSNQSIDASSISSFSCTYLLLYE